MRPLLFLLIMMCGPGSLAFAQNFNRATSGLPVISLDGLWRFHLGDDPAWADPRFDDSSWELLRSDENWAEQGHEGYSGIAWYRFRVDVPPDMTDVSLYLPYILTSYQVYSDGHLIGAYGKMPPHAVSYWGGGWFHTYTLPIAKGADRQIEIAIRVWHWPGWADDFGGGPSAGGALLGATSAIKQRGALSQAAHHWDLSSTLTLALLQTLAGIGSLLLFRFLPSEREYLWFGAMMLVGALAGWFALSFVFDVWNVLLSGPLQDMLLLVGFSLAQIAFYRNLLKGKPTTLYRTAITCILVIAVYQIVQLYGVIDPAFLPGLSTTTVNLLETLLQLPMDVWILTLLFARARRNSLDARLLLFPVVLQTLAQLFQSGAIVTYNLGWQEKFGYNIDLLHRPFPIGLLQAVDALFLLAMLFILIYRFSRTRGEEERYEAEFSAARSVQQILIPEERPQTPGLAIVSEYRPAREIGGDFFQVLPDNSDGSVMVVMGDVAGKGLQAGMLVAHIVGVIRNEASHSHDPAHILSALNTCLCERKHALATCIALTIALDGSIVLVNAGHLPPYLNGKELPMEGALPLGVIPSADFPVLRFQFAVDSCLMLMTDGIAEAQDAHGDLFGFERIDQMLSAQATAGAIAAAAQHFGQVDDITVLTITRGTLEQKLWTDQVDTLIYDINPRQTL